VTTVVCVVDCDSPSESAESFVAVGVGVLVSVGVGVLVGVVLGVSVTVGDGVSVEFGVLDGVVLESSVAVGEEVAVSVEFGLAVAVGDCVGVSVVFGVVVLFVAVARFSGSEPSSSAFPRPPPRDELAGTALTTGEKATRMTVRTTAAFRNRRPRLLSDVRLILR
jgi:hypothetical protein